MKSLSKVRGARAVIAAALLFSVSGALLAQSGAVVSARPGGRPPQALPPPEQDGIHLSLDQAIGLTLANNQDLNVTVSAAEASQFFLLENKGIFDPLLQALTTRAHTDQPVSTTLVGVTIQTRDTLDAGVQVSQLIPYGGTFTLGFNGNRTGSNATAQFVSINPAFSANLTLGFSQPLLRNFGTLPTTWQIQTARNAQDASYQLFVRSVQNTVNAVEQAYWDLAYAYENLKVKQEAKRLAVELNRITKIKIDVGSLAPIDIVQTEADMATADQDIINAEGAIGLAQDQLKRLLNFDPVAWGAAPIIPIDPVRVEQQAFNLEQGMKTALQRRPEILAQGYAVASDQLRYGYWKNQNLPALNLQANYGHNGLDGTTYDQSGNVVATGGFGGATNQIFTENFKNWSVGLVFSYPILNRSAIGASGVAQYNLETARAQLIVLQQDVIVNVRNAHRAIDTASKQIVAAAKGRELAERNLDAARKKYDNGMTTSFEVSKITNDLSDARTRELNALVIYRKAVSAYHDAVADILDWKGVKIEGMPEMAPPPVEARADLVQKALEGERAAP
jgi:outer membrane protein